MLSNLPNHRRQRTPRVRRDCNPRQWRGAAAADRWPTKWVMIRHLLMLAAVILALLPSACSTKPALAKPEVSETRPLGAHLSDSEAIEIAKRAAERWGVNWREHAPPKASYEVSKTKLNIVWPLMAEGPGEPSFGDYVWVVVFDAGPKWNYPGGHFMVYVDDKTGRSRLVGGE